MSRPAITDDLTPAWAPHEDADRPWPRGPSLSSTTDSHHQAVERVIRAMHEQLSEPLMLEEMARIAFVSQYYFNRIFRQVTGIPPCQFLYALRLEAAKRMLLTSGRSVTDICFEVGYNSLGTFTRRFTELTGVSPSSFRTLAGMPIGRTLMEARRVAPIRADAPPSGVRGRVSAPEGFRGTIFVGLFRAPIPQALPVAGAAIDGPGDFYITSAPPGRYYLLAAGLAWSEDPRQYLLYEATWRGGGQAVWVLGGNRAKGHTDIVLRPPDPFDPPILSALPLLLARGERDGLPQPRSVKY